MINMRCGDKLILGGSIESLILSNDMTETCPVKTHILKHNKILVNILVIINPCIKIMT